MGHLPNAKGEAREWRGILHLAPARLTSNDAGRCQRLGLWDRSSVSYPLARYRWEESAMTKLKLLFATVVLSLAATDPSFVDSPGKCAQQYPSANCQNFGPGNPWTDGYGRGESPMATQPMATQPMATHRIGKQNRKSRQKGR